MILGIALGVAVVVAVDLANRSALAAFELSTEAITGRATHRVLGGPAGLDAADYRRLRLDGRQRDAAPVVEGLVRMPVLGGASFTLMGVDPLAEAPFRVANAPVVIELPVNPILAPDAPPMEAAAPQPTTPGASRASCSAAAGEWSGCTSVWCSPTVRSCR